jgi:hypothetical protein
MSHEEAFVRSFIVAEKQARYIEQLASPKRRRQLLDRLDHALDYDPAFAIRIPPSQQKPASIETLLRKKGAGDICHTISSSSDWDAREMPLAEALELVVGSGMGTVLSCVPGRLAYYEAEDMSERYLLSR